MFYNSKRMNTKISAFSALVLCLAGNLHAGAFSRNIVGGNGAMPPAFSGGASLETLPQNLETLPQNAGLPSELGAPLTLTWTAPQTALPQAIPLGVFSAMPVSPNSPVNSSEAHPLTNHVEPIAAHGDSIPLPRNQNSPFSKDIRRREIELKEPLQNLKAWENDAKKSAEKGRQISDELWRLLSQGKSQERSKRHLSKRELGTVLNDPNGVTIHVTPPQAGIQKIAALDPGLRRNEEPEKLPNGGYAASVSSGRDPSVSPVGEIPSPGDSTNEILPRSWTAPSQSSDAGGGLGEDLLSGVSFAGRFPVLIVMTVSRRILDFSLFRKVGGVYQSLSSAASSNFNSKWNFFIPFSSVFEANVSQAKLSDVPLAKLPPLSGSDDVAKWWLSLSLFPILIAAFVFRRSFL